MDIAPLPRALGVVLTKVNYSGQVGVEREEI